MGTVKLFYDTEFWEDGPDHPIRPISIGIAAEDGRDLYCEFPFDWSLCSNQWLKENVQPHLQGPTMTRAAIQRAILDFVGDETPEWWGYYADYDHVVLCQIFGSMVDLPTGWPMYTLDIKQLAHDAVIDRLPKMESGEHHALIDAVWNRAAWLYLQARARANYHEAQRLYNLLLDLTRDNEVRP